MWTTPHSDEHMILINTNTIIDVTQSQTLYHDYAIIRESFALLT